MEIVVTGKRHQHAETRSQGEEGLRGGIDPDRGFGEFAQIRSNVVFDAFHRTIQEQAAYHQYCQDHVGKQCSKPNNLREKNFLIACPGKAVVYFA